MRISDWSSDVCSSDLAAGQQIRLVPQIREQSVAPDRLIDMLANMAVEVAIGAFRHAKWPMDVKGERFGHAPPPTRFRPPRQRPNRRPAVQLCSRRAIWARMSTGQSAIARSEERRVGKEWGSTCRYRGCP